MAIELRRDKLIFFKTLTILPQVGLDCIASVWKEKGLNDGPHLSPTNKKTVWCWDAAFALDWLPGFSDSFVNLARRHAPCLCTHTYIPRQALWRDLLLSCRVCSLFKSDGVEEGTRTASRDKNRTNTSCCCGTWLAGFLFHFTRKRDTDRFLKNYYNRPQTYLAVTKSRGTAVLCHVCT